MGIQSGRGNIQRRHASNYIGNEAQRRLDEVVPSTQARGLEALKVDSFEVLYYHRVNSSVPCTCQRSSAPGMYDHSEPDAAGGLPDDVVIGGTDEEIVIDHHASLFGTSNTTGMHEDTLFDPQSGGDNLYDEEIIEDDDEGRSNGSLFALSNECGICYRNGLLPGYELYGHDRKVLTTAVIGNAYGYTVDETQAPYRFDKMDQDEGFVDFPVDVPKFWKSIRFSVRNGLNHLADEFLYAPTDAPLVLTSQQIRYSSGQTMMVRVRAEQFTHVVIEFDLGLEPIRAALAQDSKATDWTLFDQMGTLSIVLPMTIASVETSDVLWIPQRGYTFKVSDLTYLRTAKNRNLDWQVQARVLQPQEGLRNIYQATRMR